MKSQEELKEGRPTRWQNQREEMSNLHGKATGAVSKQNPNAWDMKEQENCDKTQALIPGTQEKWQEQEHSTMDKALVFSSLSSEQIHLPETTPWHHSDSPIAEASEKYRWGVREHRHRAAVTWLQCSLESALLCAPQPWTRTNGRTLPPPKLQQN